MKNRRFPFAGKLAVMTAGCLVAGCFYVYRGVPAEAVERPAVVRTEAVSELGAKEAPVREEAPGYEKSDNGNPDKLQTETDEAKNADSNSEKTILVYVCGEVERPGVYELPEGARVIDAVNASGGIRDNGAPEVLNLAEPVSDADKIRVPSKEEAERLASGADGSGFASTASEEDSDPRIRLNSADKETLMKLRGIGEARAEAILRYRKEHGSFQSVEDLKKVPGIPKSVYQNIKDEIRL